MRDEYDKQLRILHDRVTEMGELCEQAIEITSMAVANPEKDVFNTINGIEEEINKIEREVELRCTNLVLRQQPVASDLRNISAATKIVTNLERIGDHAFDIADILFNENADRVVTKIDIKGMADTAVEMLRKIIKAYMNGDLALVKDVISMDDKVDDDFIKLQNEIVQKIVKEDKDQANYLDLMLIVKYYERVGDHCVDIAEWVAYAITGRLYKDKEILDIQ